MNQKRKIMKLKREFNTRPRLVLEIEEDAKIVLLFTSIKNTATRWASFVNSMVLKPDTETQQRLDVIEKFFNLTTAEAIEVAVGTIPGIKKNQIKQLND